MKVFFESAPFSEPSSQNRLALEISQLKNLKTGFSVFAYRKRTKQKPWLAHKEINGWFKCIKGSGTYDIWFRNPL